MAIAAVAIIRARIALVRDRSCPCTTDRSSGTLASRVCRSLDKVWIIIESDRANRPNLIIFHLAQRFALEVIGCFRQNTARWLIHYALFNGGR